MGGGEACREGSPLSGMVRPHTCSPPLQGIDEAARAGSYATSVIIHIHSVVATPDSHPHLFTPPCRALTRRRAPAATPPASLSTLTLLLLHLTPTPHTYLFTPPCRASMRRRVPAATPPASSFSAPAAPSPPSPRLCGTRVWAPPGSRLCGATQGVGSFKPTSVGSQ